MRDNLKPLVGQVLSVAKALQKSMPTSLTGTQWTGTNYVDAYKRNREPTANELMAELKNTAFACASINSAVCASHPPALYVSTAAGQEAAKCRTKALTHLEERRVRSLKALPEQHREANQIERVLDHPLLTLLRQVNPVHNSFDLWELTTLYQEVQGSAYWQLSKGVLGTPNEIWLLPPQNVTPRRRPGSTAVVDYYEYRTGATAQEFSTDEIIHFRYPNPRDPYLSGLAPLRACFEQVALMSDYSAMRKAIYENQAIPSAVISPAEVIGEDERDRFEAQWNQKFRRGGAGRVLVAESNMQVDVLQQSMGDLAQLAEIRATMEDICNAFSVPIAFMTTNVNMANLQAAERQHMHNCIHPRLIRRDEKLNEQLIPLYDPSGRLFLASEDPTPIDEEAVWQQGRLDMEHGIRTINEARAAQGLQPVPWGYAPWLPANLVQPGGPAGPELIQELDDTTTTSKAEDTAHATGGGSGGFNPGLNFTHRNPSHKPTTAEQDNDSYEFGQEVVSQIHEDFHNSDFQSRALRDALKQGDRAKRAEEYVKYRRQQLHAAATGNIAAVDRVKRPDWMPPNSARDRGALTKLSDLCNKDPKAKEAVLHYLKTQEPTALVRRSMAHATEDGSVAKAEDMAHATGGGSGGFNPGLNFTHRNPSHSHEPANAGAGKPQEHGDNGVVAVATGRQAHRGERQAPGRPRNLEELRRQQDYQREHHQEIQQAKKRTEAMKVLNQAIAKMVKLNPEQEAALNKSPSLKVARQQQLDKFNRQRVAALLGVPGVEYPHRPAWLPADTIPPLMRRNPGADMLPTRGIAPEHVTDIWSENWPVTTQAGAMRAIENWQRKEGSVWRNEAGNLDHNQIMSQLDNGNHWKKP